MKKKLLAGLVTGLFLVGMVEAASASPLLEGRIAASSSSVDEYANLAGLGYELLDNGDGTLTFNLTPVLFDYSPDLKALIVGVVNEAGTFNEDFTFGSSDGTLPDDELVSSDGGVTYSYTASAGSLPRGELGVFFMVNGRAPDDGNDLQRWIGITSMTSANDWGGFDWTWDNRIKFDVPANAPVPEPATMLLFGTGLLGLAGISIRRKKK